MSPLRCTNRCRGEGDHAVTAGMALQVSGRPGRNSPGQKERPVMNTKMRNLTLSAAALAALTGLAPAASADEHGRNRGRNGDPEAGSRSFERRETPRQTFRGNERREVTRARRSGTRLRGYARQPRYRYDADTAPRRYVDVPFHAPFRVFSGFHFYSAFPGPGLRLHRELRLGPSALLRGRLGARALRHRGLLGRRVLALRARRPSPRPAGGRPQGRPLSLARRARLRSSPQR